MSKTNVIAEIQSLVEKFQPLIELSKVQHMYVLPEGIESIHINYLQIALKWLRDFEPLYLEWRKIRKQQTEDRWAWYENDPETFSGFLEVTLHKKALQAAREHLNTRSRPDIFHAKKVKTLKVKE